jgi:hypothetical protein
VLFSNHSLRFWFSYVLLLRIVCMGAGRDAGGGGMVVGSQGLCVEKMAEIQPSGGDARFLEVPISYK